MKQTLLLLVATLLLGMGFPAAAGEPCSEDPQACLNRMVSHLKERGWIGLDVDHDEPTGVLRVARVVPGGPAEAAGFRVGDRLVAFNGIELNVEKNLDALTKAKESLRPGKSLTYTVRRKGYEREISVTLAKVPPEVLAQWVGNHMLDHHATVEIAQN